MYNHDVVDGYGCCCCHWGGCCVVSKAMTKMMILVVAILDDHMLLAMIRAPPLMMTTTMMKFDDVLVLVAQQCLPRPSWSYFVSSLLCSPSPVSSSIVCSLLRLIVYELWLPKYTSYVQGRYWCKCQDPSISAVIVCYAGFHHNRSMVHIISYLYDRVWDLYAFSCKTWDRKSKKEGITESRIVSISSN